MSTSGPDWTGVWSDVLGGGKQRWKSNEQAHVQSAFDVIERHFGSEPQTLLVTLCGDSPFVAAAWRKGHTVNAIELVPQACEALREQFPGEWEEEKAGAHTVYRLKEGRMTLWQGDVFAPCEGMPQNDCVVDKDAWGALGPDIRDAYARTIAGYTKPGGVVYLEGKMRQEAIERGPPFHADRSSVSASWAGAGVEVVQDLGELYTVDEPEFKQQSYLLKKAA
eukprot:TRINITY_DN381_c0_g1_i2.p2 TRINITY_DN381_c0_g1~~TRINITY_DN381_c0_g1_i2.p2  ORF type:complete len:242 (+),score=76.36 TRINITY_DN381_c0_g1_i2:62-727(+)